MDKVKDIDLYKLLDLTVDATDKDIRKAYRKTALKYHPDKNPDDAKAAEKFHELSLALEILANEETRKTYDNILKAKKANEVRLRQMDAKRKKFKDDLEARERAAREESQVVKITEEEKLAREIERLRKEGSRIVEEEQERMQKELEDWKKSQTNVQPAAKGQNKVKLRWKDNPSSERQYDRETLRKMFSKYGEVVEVVILDKPGSKTKKGLVEMKYASAAKNAASIEPGFPEIPLKIELMGGEEAPAAPVTAPAPVQTNGNIKETDFESLVMRQLRQAEERKRLIKEMEEQDEANV